MHHQYLTSHQHTEAQSNVAVAIVTVAPVLVVLVAGYVMGVLVLVIERCVYGNILKCWHVEVFQIGIKMYIECRCTINSNHK